MAGILQTIGGLIVPGLAFLLLFIMAFTMKEMAKKAMIWTAVLASVLMVAFTGGTVLTAPATESVTEEIPRHPAGPHRRRPGFVLRVLR